MKPGQSVFDLSFSTLDDGSWTLNQTHPKSFDLIAVYRGSFCPFCERFIKKLHQARAQFARLGVDLVAISTDDEGGARQAREQWQLDGLALGYDFSIDQARQWNIFVTTREQQGREVTFCEPAVFLVRPDKTLYASLIQSFPCGRPDVDDLVAGLDHLASIGFPARGAH